MSLIKRIGGIIKVAMKKAGGADAVYGFGFIGSAIYFIQHSPTVWGVILGILKAIVWPAFVAYKLLEFFKL